jgi:hypothetical protein
MRTLARLKTKVGGKRLREDKPKRKGKERQRNRIGKLNFAKKTRDSLVLPERLLILCRMKIFRKMQEHILLSALKRIQNDNSQFLISVDFLKEVCKTQSEKNCFLNVYFSKHLREKFLSD